MSIPPTNKNPLPPGTMVRDYRIERRLGRRGGFAFTYLATHVRLQKKVALKELFPDGVVTRHGRNVVPMEDDPDKRRIWEWALRKFKEEAKHLAKFRHPNIVQVNDLIEDNQTAYIVMQYVEGRSFEDSLAQMGRPLKENEVWHVLRQLLDGLEAVHREHILHRDVKPSNIYLTSDGRIILLDFGAARPDNPSTKSTIVLYSHGYSPREQYNQTNLTPAADIYSTAATMVFAITQKAPPRAPERSPKDAYVPLKSRFGKLYSPRLLEAIDAGMQFDAARRPQTIAAWRRMLPASTYNSSRLPPENDRTMIRIIYALIALIVTGLVVCVALATLWPSARSHGDSESPGSGPDLHGDSKIEQLIAENRRKVEEWETKKQQQGASAYPLLTAPAPGGKSPQTAASPASAPPGTGGGPMLPGTDDLPEADRPLIIELARVEIEGEFQAKHYAPQIKVNDTGKPSDAISISREQLKQRVALENQKYESQVYRHFGARVINYNRSSDVADVQQLYGCERVRKSDRQRELFLAVRVVQIADATSSRRSMAERIVIDKAAGYRCTLSEQDHRPSPSAAPFKSDPNKNHAHVVREIIIQDRVNYTGNRRDPSDMDFPDFRTDAQRARIHQVSDETVIVLPASTETLDQLIDGTPTVDVFFDAKTPALFIVLKN